MHRPSRSPWLVPALPAALLLAWIGLGAACDGEGSGRDALGDAPLPDAPPVKLDQLPTLPDGGDAAPCDGSCDGARDQSVVTLTAPFFLDFELQGGGLAGTRDWEWGQLAFKAGKNCDVTSYYPPSAAHSGKGMWGTKLNDCYSPLDNAKDACSNTSTTDDSVLSFRVKIPANLPNPRLSFWEWADYFLPFDWTEIRIDGKVLQQVCTGSLTVPPVWTKKTIDLKPYSGKTITVGLHFMASAVVNHSGWYVDDLSANSD